MRAEAPTQNRPIPPSYWPIPMSADKAALAAEGADVLYHLLVLLAAAGVSPDAVAAKLAGREGMSGLDEKAARSV
jgi:phosphoribosyl-ATP pyrophosphohydrolase